MSEDITLTQLRDKADVSIQPSIDLIITGGDLPAEITVSEFLFKMIKAARLAAIDHNQTLATGSQITGYRSPVNDPIQTDSSTGNDFYDKTVGLTVRISADQGTASVING